MTTNNFAIDFNGHTNYLKSFALKLTNDIHSANDLYQDTALRAFKHQDKYRPDSNMKAWLSTIMKNTFINNFRRRQRRGVVQDITNENYLLNSGGNAIENEGERSLTIEELSELIENLEDKLRIPFLMVYQGYKYDEISEELDLPLGTVKSRIFLARKLLKNRIVHLYPVKNYVKLEY